MADLPDPSQPRKPKPYNSYLRYSGLAFQLFFTIGIAGWIGYKLDQWFAFKYPILMIVFGFLAFGGSIFQIYRSINRDN